MAEDSADCALACQYRPCQHPRDDIQGFVPLCSYKYTPISIFVYGSNFLSPSAYCGVVFSVPSMIWKYPKAVDCEFFTMRQPLSHSAIAFKSTKSHPFNWHVCWRYCLGGGGISGSNGSKTNKPKPIKFKINNETLVIKNTNLYELLERILLVRIQKSITLTSRWWQPIFSFPSPSNR